MSYMCLIILLVVFSHSGQLHLCNLFISFRPKDIVFSGSYRSLLIMLVMVVVVVVIVVMMKIMVVTNCGGCDDDGGGGGGEDSDDGDGD